MYHRILKLPVDEQFILQPGMYVAVDTFRRQVLFLKENFNILPLTEVVDRVETGQSLGGCCSITFDDGWQDNFAHAFPILNKYKVPATVFLTSGFIGTTRLFWADELSYYLQHLDIETVIGQSLVLDRFFKEISRTVGRKARLEQAIEILKRYLPDEREDILAYLRTVHPAHPPKRFLMSWDEAREMQASGMVSFGAHTANHVILNQVSIHQAEEEILCSRQQLENHLGRPIDLFAYPNGNFNKDLQAILKRHGFTGAVTTSKGWVGNETALLEIPRIGIHEDVSQTIPLFFARILLKKF